MPNYQEGKIYKLWSPEGPEVYIGSTTQPLCKRKVEHKSRKNCTSKILFEKYEQVIIELIEYFPCNTREELNKRESMHIRNNKCINYQIPGRTSKEYEKDNKEHIKQRKKKYREENKDIINQKARENYKLNKDEINEKAREKYEQNKDIINQKHKKYRENNRDIIKEYQQKYYELNADKIKEKYELNKEEILERNKKYRENNKDKINQQKREKYHAKKNELI